MMEIFNSIMGVVGALCCVAMYAAVSIGRIAASEPVFYVVNGVGALLVMASAAQEFDAGDLGTIAQELIWAAVSGVGATRAWLLSRRRVPVASAEQ